MFFYQERFLVRFWLLSKVLCASMLDLTSFCGIFLLSFIMFSKFMEIDFYWSSTLISLYSCDNSWTCLILISFSLTSVIDYASRELFQSWVASLVVQFAGFIFIFLECPINSVDWECRMRFEPNEPAGIHEELFIRMWFRFVFWR